MKKLNRAAIRRLRKDADRIASVLASINLERDGRTTMVSNPAARKVLTRGYAEMIRNGCKPVVLRLTAVEAASLPGNQPAMPGADWFAAFGLDVDWRGTWVTRWAIVRGLSPEEAYDAIEVRLLADLAIACNSSGFPTMEVQR